MTLLNLEINLLLITAFLVGLTFVLGAGFGRGKSR